MSKYTPKQFSPHIYPEWGELISDLPPEKVQEIFMAICQYPHLNPDSGIWRFIKSQIDKDYNDFIERNKAHQEAVKDYWNNKKGRKGEQKGANDNKCITKGSKGKPITNNINEEQETKKKNKQKEKISFSDVFDWESLFCYWEHWKKGGKYKTCESRKRKLEELQRLTGSDFELAKRVICHCVDQRYQGFSNGSELFYKPPKDPPGISAEEESRKRLERINKIFGEDD